MIPFFFFIKYAMQRERDRFTKGLQHTTWGRLIDTAAAPSNPSAATTPSKPETRLLDTKNPLLHTHDRTLSEPGDEVVSDGQAMH